MASSRGSTASSKPPKQRLAVTAQSATSKPWFTCSQPNSISCFQTEIVATHAKQRRTDLHVFGIKFWRPVDKYLSLSKRPRLQCEVVRVRWVLGSLFDAPRPERI